MYSQNTCSMNYFTLPSLLRRALPLALSLLLTFTAYPAAASELGASPPAETPAPALAESPVADPSEFPPTFPPDVPTVIADAATRWNLPPERLLRIAWCESRHDPSAVSYSGHLGLFQFTRPTWTWATTAVGQPHASPFDPAANAEAAAWLMATDGFHHWGCR